MPMDPIALLFYSLTGLFFLDHLSQLSFYYFDRVWHPLLLQKPAPSYRWPALAALVMALLFVGMAYLTLCTFGLTVPALFTLVIIHIFLLMTRIDLKYQIIPDTLNYGLIFLGLLCGIFSIFIPIEQSVLGCILGYSSLWIVSYLFKKIRHKEGMGHGDFKLFAGLGALLGASVLPYVIFMASVLFIIQSLILALASSHRLSQPFAFGPSLAFAGLVFLFFGQEITHAYFQWIQQLVS